MFSGIVQQLGKIQQISTAKHIKTFCISFANSAKCNIGNSVAINGTCLTVTQLDNSNYTASFDAVEETLIKTNLDDLKVGSSVNTELSACYGDFIGGHMIQGHVDEKGIISDIQNIGKAWVVKVSASREFLKYVVKKGFVGIDGMSITVVDVLENSFTITLIPHTIKTTIAKNYAKGYVVNLEADVTAKYIYKYVREFKDNV